MTTQKLVFAFLLGAMAGMLAPRISAAPDGIDMTAFRANSLPHE